MKSTTQHLLQFLLTVMVITALSSLLFAKSTMAANSKSSDDSSDKSTLSYTPSESPLQDVIDAQEKAKNNNTLLLVVLGAQWCHDSTGLASHFESEALQPILEKHYTTLLVDVGLLEDRRSITERFDYPIYYATPTVMIVEPNTGALLNRASMARWAHADSIPLIDYVEYFTAHGELSEQEIAVLQSYTPTPEEMSYNEQYAARLQEAYKELSPLLKDDISGELEGDTMDNFYTMWKEVRQFRATLQKELMERTQAQLNTDEVPVSETKKATLTEYGPFSWH
ncbi:MULTISPECIES: thioredoxin family protein [unclassified Alteromonas]|uniref:thioredoxin family protein n=1 Tax=unclassified Alteromonas TaxID=2614992 RepID=UPI00068D4D4A|nr:MULTISPECIES: thioredoxin family protein [unclassified Alteromonas]